MSDGVSQKPRSASANPRELVVAGLACPDGAKVGFRPSPPEVLRRVRVRLRLRAERAVVSPGDEERVPELTRGHIHGARDRRDERQAQELNGCQAPPLATAQTLVQGIMVFKRIMVKFSSSPPLTFALGDRPFDKIVKPLLLALYVLMQSQENININ